MASMRPGLLCPGKNTNRDDTRYTDLGFNQAGAVMPRKEFLEEDSPTLWDRFNEAGAVMPRKGDYTVPYGQWYRTLQ